MAVSGVIVKFGVSAWPLLKVMDGWVGQLGFWLQKEYCSGLGYGLVS